MPAVICSYVRSPFTQAVKGALAKTRSDELAAQVVAALVKKSGVNPADIEDVILGCAFPEGEQGLNIARMVTFLSGLPVSVPGVTVNRWCGSSMEAIHMAVGRIASGAGEVFICGGVESMTRIPMGGFNPAPHPGLYQDYPQAYMSMGLTAEEVAKRFNISRKEQEEFALLSHQKAAKADLSVEIVGILSPLPHAGEGRGEGLVQGNGPHPELRSTLSQRERVTKDGCIRADSTLEKMATLSPAFDAKGTVTAATSSPVTDGATAVLVCSEEYADKNGLQKLARIRATAVTGLEPEVMGLGPVEASRKALGRAGISMKDVDIVELNEAFAAQAIAVVRELNIDPAKLNIEGGAIALGHPLGASGARVTGKAAMLLHRTSGKYALSTLCIGGGMGMATVLEKI